MSKPFNDEVIPRPETYAQARRDRLIAQRNAMEVVDFFLGCLGNAEWCSAKQFHALKSAANGRFGSWIMPSEEEWHADCARQAKWDAEIKARHEEALRANAAAVGDAG